MLGAVAGCWLLRAQDERGALSWERTVLVLLAAALVDSRNLADLLTLPVNTIAGLSLFALAARRAFAELRPVSLWRQPAGASPTR